MILTYWYFLLQRSVGMGMDAQQAYSDHILPSALSAILHYVLAELDNSGWDWSGTVILWFLIWYLDPRIYISTLS